jgi:Regulator of ribonuclease activity B
MWPFKRQKPKLEQLATGVGADEGDRFVVEQLRQQGADLSRPRNIKHYLYFPSQSVANQAAQAFQVMGFSSEVREGADHKSWLALAKGATLVNQETVAKMRSQFTELASILSGEYDGWEASPEP